MARLLLSLPAFAARDGSPTPKETAMPRPLLTPLAPPAPSPAGDDLVAFCIVERPGEPPVWVRCGSATVVADGSVNVRLDALPLSGELHLRPSPAHSHPARGVPALPRLERPLHG